MMRTRHMYIHSNSPLAGLARGLLLCCALRSVLNCTDCVMGSTAPPIVNMPSYKQRCGAAAAAAAPLTRLACVYRPAAHVTIVAITRRAVLHVQLIWQVATFMYMSLNIQHVELQLPRSSHSVAVGLLAIRCCLRSAGMSLTPIHFFVTSSSVI
jgi:hypothetical protein